MSPDLVALSVLLQYKCWNTVISHIVVLNIYAHTRCKKVKIVKYLLTYFLIWGKVSHYNYANLTANWHKHAVLLHPPVSQLQFLFSFRLSLVVFTWHCESIQGPKPAEKQPHKRKLSIFCSTAFRINAPWNQKNGRPSTWDRKDITFSS